MDNVVPLFTEKSVGLLEDLNATHGCIFDSVKIKGTTGLKTAEFTFSPEHNRAAFNFIAFLRYYTDIIDWSRASEVSDEQGSFIFGTREIPIVKIPVKRVNELKGFFKEKKEEIAALFNPEYDGLHLAMCTYNHEIPFWAAYKIVGLENEVYRLNSQLEEELYSERNIVSGKVPQKNSILTRILNYI